MNLIPFALFSQKIPAAYLAPQEKKMKHAQNIIALAVDQLFLLTSNALIMGITTAGLNGILQTLSSKYVLNYPQALELSIFPLITLAYYLVSIHSCDGMSLGMRLIKRRISHKEFENHEISTACKLTLAICSFGLLYPLIKNSFEKIDYRYEDLVEIRDEKVDLHALLQRREHEEEQVEDYQIAA